MLKTTNKTKKGIWKVKIILWNLWSELQYIAIGSCQFNNIWNFVQCFCIFGMFDQNQCAKSMQSVSLKLCCLLTLKFITKKDEEKNITIYET